MNQTSIETLRNTVNRLHEIRKNYDDSLVQAKRLHHYYTQQNMATPATLPMQQALSSAQA